MVEVCHKVWKVAECAMSEKRLRNTDLDNGFDQGFFKENVRYPVRTCRDPISLILGTRFSLILGNR